MTVLLAFAVVLLLGVLISDLAERSVLSTAVLFLVAGFLLGREVLGVVVLEPGDPIVARFTQFALFAVLFTEGMQLGIRDLARTWRLPGRALIFGMPLTMLATAVLARLVAGLPWVDALLIGAILSPTDPVFAATLVGREDVPRRVRRLLNIESGVNDGLALPVVLVLIALVAAEPAHPFTVLSELLVGIGLGVVVPWAVLRLEKTRYFAANALYQPLTAFAIGLTVLSVAALTHANEFLAAFSAGVTIGTIGPEARRAFGEFGELIAELLKLAGVLIVGVLLSPTFLAEVPWTGYAFAVLALLAVRPLALAVALFGSGLSRREWLAAAWFGPKGFASILYGLLVLQAGIPRGDQVFHLVAVVVGLSIVAHSSTDAPIAHWFADAASQRRSAPSAGADEGAAASP